jgi:hypothetical protein
LVELGEERRARTLHLLEGLLVEALHQFADHLVERRERSEALVAQDRDDPALRYLHAHFDLGLVAGLVGPRGNDDGAVVTGHLLVGGVDVGLVSVRLGDSTAQIVGLMCPTSLCCRVMVEPPNSGGEWTGGSDRGHITLVFGKGDFFTPYWEKGSCHVGELLH